MTSLPFLPGFKRIVVKVGSALLVDRDKGRLRRAWLAALAEDIGDLVAQGAEMIVVSSGAIALGRTVLGLNGTTLRLEESQASAAVGQIALARVWAEALAHEGITAGQILLTLGDTEERRRYLNARATLGKLLELRAVPVVNENDTVATAEIRYGDNDRLAARVATMAGADCLILLSDVDGLYDAPPHERPDAKLIPVVERVTREIEDMAGASASIYSRGGMRTKIEAARIATGAGVHMVIANGRNSNPLRRIAEHGPCTWFLTSSTPRAARKTFIAGTLEPKGVLVIDAGAARALGRGKSLLAAGVTRIEGEFARGDAVLIHGPDGHEVGRGLVGYDAEDVRRIIGRSTEDILSILGAGARAEVIHRDDLAVA
ncbi:glutamate 5-kinase [Rhizobiales bacterium GAS191]|nr:glutamate 5-kinase [Rhizobiales bacterium GAS113]SEC21696.1 glutamate 5-kinase [Rhizobiales bacterium GAS188]SED02687.1 glutamate 5-kinase [Rhizobiales bacterium GAS191]